MLAPPVPSAAEGSIAEGRDGFLTNGVEEERRAVDALLAQGSRRIGLKTED
jgi:hypothetical protein